jgi:hypothetical protein
MTQAFERPIDSIRREIAEYSNSMLLRDYGLVVGQDLYGSIKALPLVDPELSQDVLNDLYSQVRETQDRYREMWSPRQIFSKV